jgi:hypothetical protein
VKAPDMLPDTITDYKGKNGDKYFEDHIFRKE